MTVYFYGRNSDIGSFERGSSVATQLSKCKSYCNIKDLTIDVEILLWFISVHTTSLPTYAKHEPVTRPTYPVPITVIFI